jgi:hypothetical protein
VRQKIVQQSFSEYFFRAKNSRGFSFSRVLPVENFTFIIAMGNNGPRRVVDAAVEEGPNKENVDPRRETQPMPRREYIEGTSQLLEIPGVVRDRGIIELQDARLRRYLQWRIIILVRYMECNPFPGPDIIEDLRSYYGQDYERHDLEDTLAIFHHADYYCDPMTHDEYRLMRTARLNMMRAMLIEIPGIRDTYPALWFTFESMGDLLDSFASSYYQMVGYMGAANDFFNNPAWLPTEPQRGLSALTER